MSVEIIPLTPTPSQLRDFVRFGIDLYKDNPCYVPPLRMDELQTLNPRKNPAFDFCKAQSFLASKDGKYVGRIVAIVNDVANERSGKKEARFGFVDFIDDDEVTDVLFKAAEDWAKAQGMDEIVGPMGFTDMDHEGMLVDGFDEMGTMATIYNYPYYPRHMERLGYVKDADWIEFRVEVPDKIPDKFQRIADIVKKKYNLRTIKYTSRKKLKDDYGHALFDLINEAYDQLYGYCPLSNRQIDYYIKQYLDFLRLDCISVVVDSDDNLVAVGISMPSMSKALRKTKGKLFPFGWMHILKAINGRNDVVDLLLIAVKKEYRSRGVNALLFTDLIPVYNKNGFKFAESNIELEGNENVQQQWQYFNYRQHRRRRAWRKKLA
ncbi:MAG: N-acetyltransferase [Firmicutes bacterium]|nr:N-acetyltransferase [Bacillota bacterium]MCM1400479.1 N-acetyltransferase [Bacteroides sp.]MCM1477450.1 N-acetyltransferase [Bacteroides sp.]